MVYYSNFQNDKPYYLPVLLIISVVAHFPFVLSGFGEIDATKIAVCVIDIINHGPDAAFANLYFTDVIPLYILYLSWLMELLDHNYSLLPIVMNYTNAVFGTLTVIPAFVLIKRLFRNSTVAFCSVLALIFAPSFYQSTIMGFPHLIALFFVLVSLCFYLRGLEQSQKNRAFIQMFLACVFLTVAFLFKSDYVLVSGIYFGLLIIKKINDKWKIFSSFMTVFVSGVLFLLFRNMILGPSSGTTMSKAGMSDWYNFSITIPRTLDYFTVQTEPIVYGAGVITFCLLVITLIFYLFKKRYDLLAFVFSWTALPTLFWMVLIGNNARHNMISTLPFLVIIVFFLYEKAPKYIIVLTGMLILGNFLVTSPSFSILKPSGNLFKSNALLVKRMEKFQTTAKDIVNIDADKMVILGYFHNPNVVFEIMRSRTSYEAQKIGRENYRLLIGDKEYVFIYFVVVEPNDMEIGIDQLLAEYDIHDHLFVSATYDLQSLEKRGLKNKTLDIIKRSSL